MAFCEKCGTQINEGNNFCQACGAPVANQAPAQEQAPVQNQTPVQNVAPQDYAQNYTQDYTQNYQNQQYAQPDAPEADIQANKANGVLAYLGILVLIPLLTEKGKNSRFARFHVGQGLTLLALDICYGIANAILSAIVNAIFPPKAVSLFGYTYMTEPNGIAVAITTILSLVSIVFLVLMIIGIVNAAQGKMTKLPVIGSIDIISKHFDK